MRDLSIKIRQTKEELMQKTTAEKTASEKEAASSKIKIMENREKLKNAIAKLVSTNQKLDKEVNALTFQQQQLDETENMLTQKLSQTDSMIKELVGVIRVNAKDIHAMVTQNLQTALSKNSYSFLESINRESQFPGMDDVRGLAQALYDQIESSGSVVRQKCMIIDRAGLDANADILVLGPFTAAYRVGNETGFCNYSPAGRKLYALSRLPSGRMQKNISRYIEGKNEAVTIDISRGGALRQLTHDLSLRELIPKGGPIVWPILIIFALGLLIIFERIFFLLHNKFDANSLIRQIENLFAENKWRECTQTCELHIKKPVARVINAGLLCCEMQREEMENALQEAILKEIPPMERFLSTLGMLAAIAPLLGLLGTVTGMIETFHVITLYGTGDPRLMSGGISEALVTTMLGLSVAIPLMLSQTLLNRAVDKKIGEMEEKAVALVNIIHKNRGQRD